MLSIFSEFWLEPFIQPTETDYSHSAVYASKISHQLIYPWVVSNYWTRLYNYPTQRLNSQPQGYKIHFNQNFYPQAHYLNLVVVTWHLKPVYGQDMQEEYVSVRSLKLSNSESVQWLRWVM